MADDDLESLERYDKAKAALAVKRAALEQQLQADLAEASQTSNASMQQIIAKGIVTALPLLLGAAIGGKRGAAAAADAGASAGTSYGNTLESREKQNKAGSLLKAKMAQDELKGISSAETGLDLANVKAGGSIDAAAARAKNQSDLQDARFAQQKELEGIRQANRIAAKGISGGNSQAVSDPDIAAALDFVATHAEEEWPEETRQTLIKSGHYNDLMRAKSQNVRGKDRKEAFAREQSKFNIPGYKRTMSDGTSSDVMTTSDYKKATTWASTMPVINNLLNNVSRAIDAGDQALFAQNKQALIEQIKNLRNYGAAFSIYEMNIVESQLGQIADVTQAKQWAKQVARGGTAKKLFNSFRQNLLKDYTVNMITSKTIPDAWVQKGNRFFRKTPDGKALIEIPYSSMINEISGSIGEDGRQ